ERMLLQSSARQLSAEANDISENWGAGGTYRQITTALIGAAGGNISAGNAAFVQSLVVNYVQQRGAGYIGDLVANGELTEGSPLHAALHGIVACAGAAASSQSCGSGAAGAAASSLLTGLFSQSSPDESEEQREAKRNLIVSLVTGLAATSASIDPTAANTAAGAAVDNNWLATQQEAQARKEYEAAKGLVAKAQVAGKWLAISGKQEILTRYGIGKGLAESSWGDITGLADFAMHPIDGLNGLSSLISDPEVRAQLGEDVANKFSARIDTIKNALEVGGDDNAVAMGQAMGELAWQIGTAVTGVGTAAKGVVGLAKAGIKVSSAELDKMADLARLEKIAAENAKNRNPMSAMTDSEAGELVDRNVLEAKAQKSGKTLDEKGPDAPKITIKDHYDHHLNMVDDIKDQLLSQGYRVSEKEISFGSSCGIGRCRPDIVAEAPDGTLRIIEVKTGNADLSIRQSEIFPQIENGNSIPRGKVAESFGLKSGIPLKEQGYPNGIPIEIMNFPGAK
ncbi:hypothetical protein P4A91_25350, partial [Pseudomonas syringae]|nr:hypothetical protein [Pseudomonas syringae]